MEFAREKRSAIGRWLTSTKVDNYDKLKQLVSVGEFKHEGSAEIGVG